MRFSLAGGPGVMQYAPGLSSRRLSGAPEGRLPRGPLLRRGHRACSPVTMLCCTMRGTRAPGGVASPVLAGDPPDQGQAGLAGPDVVAVDAVDILVGDD